MADKQPNIDFFFGDNFGWGELGCYGGGELRGAPTPRMDALATEGLQLLNFNVEAQCTPSRSAPDRASCHPVGHPDRAYAGGPDGMTRWEVTLAKALSDAGYATGMWGKWHLGSDLKSGARSTSGSTRRSGARGPRTRSAGPCSPTSRTARWPPPLRGEDADPAGTRAHLHAEEGREVQGRTYDAEFRAGFDRKITEWAFDFMTRSKEAGKPFYTYLPYTQVHIPPIPDPEYAGYTKRGNMADILTQMDAFTGGILDNLDELGIAEDTIVVWASDNGADTPN